MPPNNARQRQMSKCVCAGQRGQDWDRGRDREGEALLQRSGNLRAGTKGGRRGSRQDGLLRPDSMKPVDLSAWSLWPDVNGTGSFARLLGLPPCNGGPIAHFQSGPVPSTQAELIKHSFPLSEELKSNLLIEQLVFTAPPPLFLPPRLALIPRLHHLRLRLLSIN